MPPSFLDSASSTFGSINEFSGNLALSGVDSDETTTTMHLVASDAQSKHSVMIEENRSGFIFTSDLTEMLTDQMLAEVEQPVSAQDQGFINKARGVLLNKQEKKKEKLEDVQRQAQQTEQEECETIYRNFRKAEVVDDREMENFEEQVYFDLVREKLGLVDNEKRRLAWAFLESGGKYGGRYNATRRDMVVAKIKEAQDHRV
jgi:hypothetical protein